MVFHQSYAAQGDIPEALREHYEEKDGRWLLITEPPLQDNAGAIAALNTERGLRREAEKQLTEYKVRYEGIDPDEVKRLRDRVHGLDESEIYDKQGIEALVARRTQSMKEEHDRVVTVKERELAQQREKAQQFEQRWRDNCIRTALTGASARAGVAKEAMDDAVARGLGVFNAVDEQGQVLAKQGDDLRYGKDGITPLTPDEWILALKPVAPHLWPPSSGGGAPPYRGSNGWNPEWDKLPPTDRLTKAREARVGQR